LRTAAQSEATSAGEWVNNLLKNGRLRELIVSFDQQGCGNRDEDPAEGDHWTSEAVDVAVDNFGCSSFHGFFVVVRSDRLSPARTGRSSIFPKAAQPPGATKHGTELANFRKIFPGRDTWMEPLNS